MTDEQKSKIAALRNRGASFCEIAKKMNVSINTVKSFCRRCKSEVFCKSCGKPIVQPKGTREKKFCSDKCRMAWWNSHRDDVNKKAIYSYKCCCCGSEFQVYGNSHRKYCSRACYIKSRFGGAENV